LQINTEFSLFVACFIVVAKQS